MKRKLWIPMLFVVAVLAAGANHLLTRRASGGQEPTAAANVTPAVHDEAVDLKAAAEPQPAETGKSAGDRSLLLETVGSLAAAHYFQTYLNIGFVADGKANGTYTEKDASRVLDSVLSLLDSMDRKLAALEGVNLDAEDRASLEQLRAASALLRRQGEELHAYWASGKEESAADYETLRKNSWTTISKFMGISR